MSFLRLSFEKRLLDSHETPEMVFDHLQGPYSFLLRNGNYSYIGYDPFLIVRSKKGVVYLEKRKKFFNWSKHPLEQIIEGDSLKILSDLLKQIIYKNKPPVPFFGGAAGFFSYDFGVSLVNIQQQVFNDTQIPDYLFCFVDKVIAFDHISGEIFFIAGAETDLDAQKKLLIIQKDLQKPVPIIATGKTENLHSNLNFPKYKEKIIKIKEFLKKGETYQVNFSQRYEADCTLDSWQIYKNLTSQNPAPFGCYFDMGNFQIISNSPELLLRKNGSEVESWPIKGTIARGRNEIEDNENIETLVQSEKNSAELSMIVDLVRNDLGQVCKAGSVIVKKHKDIEKYGYVIHTLSRVQGKLEANKDFFDTFKALFPGGSITGCPKKRTIQIIDQLEDYRRDIYTGSAGFINFQGNGVMNILIRTLLKKQNKIYFHAGGGIVIDSDPREEYQETLDKGKAIMQVLKNLND